MRFHLSREEILRDFNDVVPEEDQAELAARMGVSEDALVDSYYESVSFYETVILAEPGGLMTPEEAEEFVEPCMCEYN